MVKALFDTNILIDHLQGRPEAHHEMLRYREHAISLVTWMEVMAGVAPEHVAETEAFLRAFDIIAIDAPIAGRAVEIRRSRRIKLPDAIIQASAEVHSLLLVTRNTKDFDESSSGVRIPYQF